MSDRQKSKSNRNHTWDSPWQRLLPFTWTWPHGTDGCPAWPTGQGPSGWDTVGAK